MERTDVGADDPIPVGCGHGSGSGPRSRHQPAYARLQAPRVADARGLDLDEVLALIDEHTEGRTFGFLGEPRVNVLVLNLALEDLSRARAMTQARGSLRIYLGFAAGVGKTFAMLERGHRGAASAAPTSWSGSSRPTAGRRPPSAIGDLEVVPRRTIEYRGRRSRRWTSTRSSPGARGRAGRRARAHERARARGNEKRWQDVEELLDAGIDVISTVNIQHLESLNDVVERITGVQQRETIPDESSGPPTSSSSST